MSLATTDAANPDQIGYWNAEAGQTWAELQDRLDRQIEPLGRRAMAALAPRPGERLIDVGCGCAQTTLELAAAVGPRGEVLGVDVSEPMLRRARARPSPPHAAKARFVEADAQVFPFEPAGADGVFTRFGVMFFAVPLAAFANLRAALRPGGRLAFVCWRDISLNPFMTLPFETALPFLPPQPPVADPQAPGPFAFADGERLRAILTRSGFTDIALAAHDEAIGGGDIEATTETALRIGPLGRVLRENPHLEQAVRGAVRAAIAPHAGRDGVLLPSASWIVSARTAVTPAKATS
ncbi:MAG: class I SAM-dependent methyltransferase [Caulobacteraceae bacterium]